MSPGRLVDNVPLQETSSEGSSSGVRTPNEFGAEAVAIVGMGCRFPGDSDTPDQFWDMLLQKRKCYSEPPKSRFNIDGFHTKKSRPGGLKPRGAYFISDTTFDFDPPFFGITKPEAEAMDPQQRKLLECVHEAFENGGIPLEQVSGTNTGVYAVEIHLGTDKMGVLSPTSTCHTFDASADGYGRGEGIGAIYLKRLNDAIRDGDPIRGIIRGTAANANGKTSGITQPSAKGQATTSYFETHGTGTAVGDPIELKGIADVFLPEGTERKSLLVGGVKPNVGHAEAASAMACIMKVAYALETGKIPATIGIEKFNPKIDFRDGKLQVVQNTRDWPEEYTVRRASVNSFGYGGANGHVIMEAVSSMLLGYQSFKTRETSREDMDFDIKTGTMGSGKAQYKTKERTQFLLPFSAHDAPTLKANIASIRQVADEYDTEDLAYTLASRRSRFFHRGFAVVDKETVSDDLEEQATTLGKRGSGANIVMVFTGQGAQTAQMGRDLMQDFPSYLQTIRDLDSILQGLGDDAPTWSIETELLKPKATSAIDQVHLSQPLCTAVQVALVDLLTSWGITPKATVGHSSGAIAAAYAAGSVTKNEAILYAYFRGVAVSGLTSKGTMLAVGLGAEEAEPYVEQSIRIACHNSPQSVTLSGDEDAAARVQAKLDKEKIFVRAVKTSGRAYHSHHMKEVGGSYLESLERALRLHGGSKDARKVEGVVYSSSVYGKIMDSDFVPGPEYWKENLESPVLFTQALEVLLNNEELSLNTILEVGPHSALAGPIRQIRDKLGKSSKDLDYIATLVRGENATTRLLDLAGSLFIKGHSVNLENVNAIERKVGGTIQKFIGKTLVDLPRYNWNYKNGTNLRTANRFAEEHRLRKYPRHDLLGSKVPGTMRNEAQWRNMLDIADLAWLDQHRLSTQPVLPAVGYLVIATEAARQFFAEFKELKGSFRYVFPHMTVKSALNLPPPGTPVEIMTRIRFQHISDSIQSGQATFAIQSHLNGIWTEHAIGSVEVRQGESDLTPLFSEDKLQEPKTAHTWYRGFSSIDLNYGAAFNGLSDIRVDPWGTDMTALSKLLPTDIDVEDSRYPVHPGTLDTCMQAILIGAHSGSLKELNQSYIPVSMENVMIWSYDGVSIPAPEEADGRILATGKKSSLRALNGTVQLFDQRGRPIFAAEKVDSIAYAEALNGGQKADRHPYIRVVWKQDIEHSSSLSSKNDVPASLLQVWASGLVSVAKAHASNPLAKVILESLNDQYEFSEAVALDLSSSKVGEETFELESICLSILQRLANDQSTAGEALPSSFETTLDLVAHKQPGLDIMFYVDGTNTDISGLLEHTLGGKSSLKRYRTVEIVTPNGGAVPALTEKFADFRHVTVKEKAILEDDDATYDLVVLLQPASVVGSPEVVPNLKKNLKESGRLLIAEGRKELDAATGRLLETIVSGLGSAKTASYPTFHQWSAALQQEQLGVKSSHVGPSGWTLLTEKSASEQKTASCVILSRQSQFETANAFVGVLGDASVNATIAALVDADFVPEAGAAYLSLVEFGDNFFETLSETEFKNLQSLADSASSIFWVTTGNLLRNTNAHAATVMGLGRTLQTEYAQLHFFHIDLDHQDATLGASQVARIVSSFDPQGGDCDKEHIVSDGIYYVSRFSEDKKLDSAYGAKLANEPVAQPANAEKPVRLAIGRVGALDTLHWTSDDRDKTLQDDQVEVEVKSVGVNMKEIATFRGTFNSESLSHEGSGIVRRVSPGVTNVAVGDRVCWMGKGVFSNVERFSAQHLHKIADTDSFEQIASMPLAFSTAVYGLLHLGRLRKGEKVLIQSATGGVGLAAVQIAKMVGAEIFATVGTDDKKVWLKEHYGLDENHVFNSRSTQFADEIRKITNGYGIDVSLNSLVRESLHASWSLMASGGRHIEIGRTDILDYGTLDLDVFKRAVSFSAFDFGAVASEQPWIPAQVMSEVMQYYREGKIIPLAPLFTYSASEIISAFETFSDGNRIGKVVVNFDNKPLTVSNLPVISLAQPNTSQVQDKPKGAKFRADGTYLLIGCLGGLGRCLSRWMVDNGARNLTYLARSGASNPAAARFVEDLEARGVTVHIVKGDVSNRSDVDRAVAAAGVPVLGMVQGAMTLQDYLFSKLNLDKWNYAVQPKVQGTLNLHSALEGHPLDFFIMLSSISAMTGAPTQSNYCAGNTFMDFFARYRRQHDLPATTVGLTMVLEVGFVSQDEKIEQGIARGGVPGINEKEFIELMETAILPAPKPSWKGDANANVFLVSGLDPSKISPDALESGFRFWSQPRIGPLAVSLQEKTMSTGGSSKSSGGAALDLPSILEAVIDKFAKTFMIPAEDFDETKPLVAFGMDSMIGIALRNWVFGTYSVDVPTSDFMGPLLTAQMLAEKIFNGLQE
ncbi:hypothetical protein M409DRAFT_61833 [Zasmidium cellare ATCC 36951]|uniref:Uncharacterized protein n=1 Tax=Zasmidium cellare ATCC 36951 TaxID=1080233 RepID=A0A6A6D1V1_ZASCE|nr:uncharacterized protein M409DRAFT_61833 [Zasmidium cellare ATCC 36951]KAF2173407.1 hypothetical protein M409DRAFT_61833 [Zasmidium cellare ATCC 36951]